MSKDWGSKPGSGGVASATLSNVQRRERLRALAMETADISNGKLLFGVYSPLILYCVCI